MARTTAELIDAVRIATTLPNNQALITDDRLLALAQEEMELKVIPPITNLNQNYFVRLETFPIVNQQDTYSIPSRAMGRMLRELKITDGTQIRNLALIELEDAHFFNYQATPNSFYFMEDKIKLVPVPQSSTLSLDIYYILRLGRLTVTSNCAQVVSINTGANTVNVSVVPSGFAVNGLVDFIQGIAGNTLLGYDYSITNISGVTLTFASLPTGLAVGDWLAPAQYSPVLQVPEEAFSYLVTLAGARCLKSVGDLQGAASMLEAAPEQLRMFEMMIAPRIQGEPIKIINRISLLRGNRSRIRRGIVYP